MASLPFHHFSSTHLLPNRQKFLFLDVKSLMDEVLANEGMADPSTAPDTFKIFKETWKRLRFERIHLSLAYFDNTEKTRRAECSYQRQIQESPLEFYQALYGCVLIYWREKIRAFKDKELRLSEVCLYTLYTIQKT